MVSNDVVWQRDTGGAGIRAALRFRSNRNFGPLSGHFALVLGGRWAGVTTTTTTDLWVPLGIGTSEKDFREFASGDPVLCGEWSLVMWFDDVTSAVPGFALRCDLERIEILDHLVSLGPGPGRAVGGG